MHHSRRATWVCPRSPNPPGQKGLEPTRTLASRSLPPDVTCLCLLPRLRHRPLACSYVCSIRLAPGAAHVILEVLVLSGPSRAIVPCQVCVALRVFLFEPPAPSPFARHRPPRLLLLDKETACAQIFGADCPFTQLRCVCSPPQSLTCPPFSIPDGFKLHPCREKLGRQRLVDPPRLRKRR